MISSIGNYCSEYNQNQNMNNRYSEIYINRLLISYKIIRDPKSGFDCSNLVNSIYCKFIKLEIIGL